MTPLAETACLTCALYFISSCHLRDLKPQLLPLSLVSPVSPSRLSTLSASELKNTLPPHCNCQSSVPTSLSQTTSGKSYLHLLISISSLPLFNPMWSDIQFYYSSETIVANNLLVAKCHCHFSDLLLHKPLRSITTTGHHLDLETFSHLGFCDTMPSPLFFLLPLRLLFRPLTVLL